MWLSSSKLSWASVWLAATCLLPQWLGVLVVNAQFSATILHVNDHHSNLEEDDFDLENSDIALDANYTEDELVVLHGGFPRIVSVLKAYTADTATYPNLIKLHAGDALTGTAFYSFFRGDADADMMKLACFDAFVLGNHEFDDGDSNLAEFIQRLQNGTDCPDGPTPVLSANLLPGNSSALLPLQESGTILPFTVKTFGTEQVAIMGITIRGKTLVSSSPDPDTDFQDEVIAATATAEMITTQMGINKIIALTHIGLSRDLDWMVEIPGVDVVVGGDSHTLMADEFVLSPAFNPNEVYPLTATRTSDGATVCVVQAWEYSKILGELTVEWDDQGNVLSCTGNPIVPFENSSPGVTAFLEGLGPAFVSTVPDPEVAAILQTYIDRSDPFTQEVIAFVPEDICFERIPGQGRSEICDVEETASQGGAVCNLVAQAFLDQEPTAELAIQNGGGCRTDIEAGNFTYGDAIELLPFSNTMVTLVMSGIEIKNVLEEALENALFGGSTGAYPYASGLRYDVDATADFGSRVSAVEVNPRLEGDWMPISNSGNYVVVTNSFVASGRDGYTTFGEIDPGKVVNTYKEYSQVFIDYAIQEQTLVSPPLDFFSTKSFIPLPDETDVPVDTPADTMTPTVAPTTGDADTITTAAPTMSPVEDEAPSEPSVAPSIGSLVSLMSSTAMVLALVVF